MMLALLATAGNAIDVRVKDVVRIRGISETPLIGYGLVVGLPGTGDRYETIISDQSLRNLLEKFGITISKDRLFTRNTAAVMVTSKLSPFRKANQRHLSDQHNTFQQKRQKRYIAKQI